MFCLRKRLTHLVLIVACAVSATGLLLVRSQAATLGSAATLVQYDSHVQHDPEGVGKFYMGREIAQVMGPGGIEWLDRDQRETEEHPAQVFSALSLHRGDIVADLGAGAGYFTLRMAPLGGDTGKVLAVDVQDAMLQALKRRSAAMKVQNVEVIKGNETDPHLPPNAVDLVLLVDVYHEFGLSARGDGEGACFAEAERPRRLCRIPQGGPRSPDQAGAQDVRAATRERDGRCGIGSPTHHRNITAPAHRDLRE